MVASLQVRSDYHVSAVFADTFLLPADTDIVWQIGPQHTLLRLSTSHASVCAPFCSLFLHTRLLQQHNANKYMIHTPRQHVANTTTNAHA